MRYHQKIYFPKKYNIQLCTLTNTINELEWRYTSHALDNIKNRACNIEEILLFIKNITLFVNQIFEYYTDVNFITKICYRVPYNKNLDLILVIGEGKKLITIYYNAKEDEHFTLNQALYTKGGK